MLYVKEYETFIKRHAEITEQLNDPAVFGDHKKLQALNREFSRVNKVLEKLKAYHKVCRQIEEAEGILNKEKDPEMIELAELELEELRDREGSLEQAALESLVPPDENDEKNAVLEIRAGTGGLEAALFAGDLYRMYARYCEERRWKMEVLSMAEGDAGGYKEIIVFIEGSGAYGCLKFESGTHRVQRVPETESGGRIHTSAVTVACLPETEEVDLQIAESEIRVDVFRSSGPGGQSVNTTDSAVRVTHLPTGMIVTCQDEKSQHKNKAKALMVLRSRLMDQIRAEQEAELSKTRKAQIGSGDRSEKIRTYNFPQGRVTDHRVNLTVYNLQSILDGRIDQFVETLQEAERKEKVEAALTR